MPKANSTFAAILILALARSSHAQTVSLALESSQDGQTITAGTTVDWQITFTVSPGDNAGLALLVCDLEQDGANPESLDLPPASGIPAAMNNFSRPDGISNPGETVPATGYTGVQRGDVGAKDLIQIGGAQNTTGAAMSPGTGIAENANVIGSVGQSGAEFLASGQFIAPATSGNYTFALANARANTLQTLNTPPASSPVDVATIQFASQSITFTVSDGFALGDMNCDGAVDTQDISPFVLALIAPGQYSAENPGCDVNLADMNIDTNVDGQDVAQFSMVLTGA